MNPFADLRGDSRVPQLGLRPPAQRARGRRRGRGGAVPEHGAAVLPARQPRGPPAGRPRSSSSAGPGCAPTTGGWPTSAPRPRPARGDGPDLPQRRRRRGRRDPLGARCRALRRGPAARGARPTAGLPPLYAPDYEPIWAVCEELDMPMNNHSGQSAPDYGEYPASMAVWMVELGWFSHRVFWHLVFGGVFDRHPGLQARAHRAVGGLGARASSGCSTTSSERFAHAGRGRGALRRRPRRRDEDVAVASAGRGSASRARASSGPASASCATRSASTDHVGPGLPARRGHLPVHDRGVAEHVRGRADRRGRGHGRRQRGRGSTASTSSARARWRSGSARRIERGRRSRSRRSRPTASRSRSQGKM